MADTTTTNLLLTKPEVGASTDTWGTKINTDLDSVDAVFAAAGTGTSVGLNVGSGKTLKVAGTTDFSANLTFTGTGNRITGDFSNATIANRVAFQTSTTNGNTFVNAIPNGTGTSSGFATYNNSDTANASFFTHQVVGTTEARINSTLAGTGTYLPMTFYTGGSERVRVDTSGNVGIGTNSPGAKLDTKGLVRSSIGTGTGAGGAAYAFYQFGTSATATENWHIGTEGDGSFRFYNQGFGAGLERMRIDSSGNLLVGTSSSTWLGSLLKSGGTITLASGASINLSSAVCGGAIVSVYVGGSGNGGLFYLNYSSVAAKITGDGAATDTGADFAVYKSAASHTSTLKNKSVSTQTFSVVVVAGQMS